MKLEALRKQIYQEIQDASKQAKSRLDASCIELLQKQKKIDELIHKVTQNQLLLQKQSQSWAELIQKFNQALRQLGDASTTAMVITEDLAEI